MTIVDDESANIKVAKTLDAAEDTTVGKFAVSIVDNASNPFRCKGRLLPPTRSAERQSWVPTTRFPGNGRWRYPYRDLHGFRFGNFEATTDRHGHPRFGKGH